MNTKELMASISYIIGVIILTFSIGYILQPTQVHSEIPCPDDGCGSNICFNGSADTFCDIDDDQNCQEKSCDEGDKPDPIITS